MAVVRKIPDVLSGPEFWVILQSQSERSVAAGGPINPFGWDTCLLTCLLEKEVAKLFWGIMTPSAVVTVALGIWLITGSPDYYLSAAWMQVKLALIVLLLGYHTVCWVFLEKLKTDSTVRSHRYFRVFNEIPIFMMVTIVILVVVKPVFGA